MDIEKANWAVITGSTGGIGSEITRILAARGQNLILLNRSEIKSSAQASDIIAKHPNLKVEQIIADLMDTTQIEAAIAKIKGLSGRIDALYNNSGVLTATKTLSKQGFESQFAVNTLAPYRLTVGLQDKMARPAAETPGIVVLFSSSAVNHQKELRLDELANPETVGGLMDTYAQTKLAVTALAPALAESLGSENILIRAVDPGATRTAMTTDGNSAMPKILRLLAPILFSSAAKQAAKVVDAAAPAAFDKRTGIYVANLKERRLPKPAADKSVQERLLALLNRSLVSSI